MRAVFFFTSKALSWVALPAAWTAALLAVAFLARRRRALAVALVVIACATLCALASPPIANALGRVVVASGQSTMKPELEYDVAVVLGGNPARIVAGADVMRRGRARYLLYSGALGAADSAAVRSDLIARGVPGDRIVIEDRSRNTRENAVESASVIAARGWRSILLVTSAAHVERADGCFHRIGLRPDVLPVAVWKPILHVWPRAVALERSSQILHELVGRVVYRVLGYSER